MLGRKEQVSSRNRTSQKLILLVEDDAINAACIAQIISQETPYHVFQTSDSVRALEVIKHLKPDLFLFDYRLHNMNGIELYDRLQTSPECANVPVILLTTNLDKRLEEIEERNMVGLSKPVDLDDLLNTIEKALI